ncbi:hypothetical protein OPQ81_007854 [Rhizoctonia solani]|nr:hypothetical protein OPQ81_007854 [Rhizoctonia solani]
MNEQATRSKFPTIRRSGLTLEHSLHLPPGLAPLSIERDLYEVDNEGPSIGKFTTDNNFFILESVARRKYPVRTFIPREGPQRPPPPPLKDRPNARDLPKKTAFGFHIPKVKKRRKGRPTNEVKRPRPLPNDHPKQARARKSALNIQLPKIKVKPPEKRNRADVPIQIRQPGPSNVQLSPVRFKRARKVAFEPPSRAY